MTLKMVRPPPKNKKAPARCTERRASRKAFTSTANGSDNNPRLGGAQRKSLDDDGFVTLGAAARVVIARLAHRCRITPAHARVAAELHHLIGENMR